MGQIKYSLGLIGYPLTHSLSPRLHHAGLKSLGLEGNYSLFPVPPGPDGMQALERLLLRIRRGGLDGLNVTIPHKQTVMPLLDELTPVAQAIGAVNTIYLKDGRLFGDNTDSRGFIYDLKRVFGERMQVDSCLALVLGAGGSARAVVYALSQEGWMVTVAARRLEQARTLCEQFSVCSGKPRIVSLDQSGISTLPEGITLIVNTTPLGMVPELIKASPWPDGMSFPVEAMIYDLVYNPPETRFIRDARAAGLLVATGLGMLVEQAALALECWIDLSPKRQVIRDSVREFEISMCSRGDNG